MRESPSGTSSQAPLPGDRDPAITRDRNDRVSRTLPLQGTVETVANGWALRLPVRAEHVTVTKQAVVVEEVVLRRSEVDDVVHVDETLRRERLRVSTEGDVEVANQTPSGPDAGSRSGTRRSDY